jgi:hypothetical protein
VIECGGDPRAMGEAQGAACRDAVRAHVASAGVATRGRLPASLRPFVSGRVLGTGPGRELARHYPHQCERIQGLARGSRLATEPLVEMFVRASRDELAGEVLAREAPIGARAGAGARLVRALADADWLLRRSAPEVGFASVEITLPWLATGVAGVNAAGVVAAADPRPHPERTGAPSALLLVQECLQRFEDVAGCLAWALGRPAAGGVRLVFGDASGRVAEVEIREGRRVSREIREPEGELDKGLVLDPRARSVELRAPGFEPQRLALA